MIVTVTHTVMAGTVVRWYQQDHPDVLSGDILDAIEPMLSASRHGVRVGTFLHLVPDALMTIANNAHFALIHDSDADLSHLATHRRKGMFGPLEPVPSTGETP